MSKEFRENLAAYTQAIVTAEEIKDQFEEQLLQLVGVYHGVSVDYFNSIHYNIGGALVVGYEYTCRGCSDRDSLIIPLEVMNADDVIGAAKQDLKNREAIRWQTYNENLKREALANVERAQKELDRILGPKET